MTLFEPVNNTIPVKKLSNGLEIPVIGLGTYGVKISEVTFKLNYN